MKHRRTRMTAPQCLNGGLFLLLLVGLGGCNFGDVAGEHPPIRAAAGDRKGLRFEPNQGQVPTHSDYLTHGPGYFVSLKATEATLTLKRSASTEKTIDSRRSRTFGKHPLSHVPEPAPATLRVQLIGANPKATVHAIDLLSGKSNYISGTVSAQWHTNISGYAIVKYQAVYPGIDLVYHGDSQGGLSTIFQVAPGQSREHQT